MIEIRDLSFSYGKTPFTEHLYLTLNDGTFTALIGENGSGKSTLLKLMTGNEAFSSGNILLDGKNLQTLKKNEIARRLSYFPQSRPIPDMTAKEVVMMGRYPYTRGKLSVSKNDILTVESVMTDMNISHFAERNMKTLSFGERQRIYLTMLLAQDTGTCLFDEPTNFMDISAKFAMLSKLTELKKQGKCILCILHDISLALRYADRIIIMKNGNIFADGSPEELCQNGMIEKAFDIRLQTYETNGEHTYIILPNT
ncbi:MAG: ABC transporter ATP-binding protein [Clostridia bacterium]|nr:ABC transporter ATP-binding protein [Clostridia bacterium]